MADINKFSLGKKGKLGEIDFNKIKSGLKASDLIKNNPNLKSIFERLDKNGNGELDRSELEALRELIAKLSGDDNLSINEAKKLKDNDEKIGRSKAKLLIEFLNKMSENAKAQGIKNVETNTGGGIEVVTYEDGHTEELFQDGSVVITVKDGNKTTKTHKDKKGNLLKETTTEDGNETKTNYTNGKKVNKIITKKNSVETINYDSTGIPKNKTVKENKSGIEDYYEYENGKFVLKKRTDSKNNSETVYNGTRATTTKTDGKNKDVTVRENGEVIRNTSTRINDDNKTEMTDTIYNGDDYTENFYLNDALRRQKKSIDGKEYEVHYDADGNTEGIIVQNGESIALIAKRFNCSVTDLIRVNALKVRGKYPKAYFVVGETIKIPNQMEADDYAKIQAGRKSRTEVLGDYRRIEEEKRTKAEQKAAEAQQKAEKAAQKRKEAENKSKKVEAKKIAQEIFDACDDEAAAIGKNRFQNALKRVNSNNVIDVLKAYKEIRPEESIIAVIANEKGSSCSVRKEASKYLARVLYAKGLAVGVDKNELDKLLAEFNKEVNAQYDKIGVVKCDQMETILDAMLGSVIAKMQKTEEISEADAIKQAGEIAAGDSSNANKDFNSAREDEGWIAKVSDTVCGWFGCKTIGEMKEKLGEYAGEIMKLVNAKNENEFKKIFKEVFGIEFDKQKVAAYNTAVENYSLAIFYSEAGKVLPGLIRAGSTLSENNFKGEIKKKLNYSDADLEMLIFANAKEGESVTDTLIRCLNDLDKTYKSELAKLTKGGSLDDMAKDIDLIKKGLFGTKDIVKEVNIFNKNMQITEAVGTGVFEILGTVALGFIPGGQALAGARIAAMTARYGRLAKVAAKGLKVLSTSVNAGIASATVLATDGRDMKEIKQHIKMNMSFAAGGVVAGELAPFVAKTFKLTSNIAKELIEDTMDVFVSYCTSKGLGMEYAKTDAGVDFLVGLIMARVAHMNLKAKSAKTGDVSNTPKAEQKAEAPKAEQKAEAPKAEQKAEAPKAEQKAEAPKAEQKAEAPKAEQKAEAPKAEQKAEAPKAEQKTEAPKAEQKAEAPKAEQKQKTDKSDKTEKKTETSETKSTSKAEKAEDTKKSGFSADELKQKLGKKLARSYKAIEEAIEKMKDTVDFNKIYKRITVKFKDYAEVAADLINKLKLKAKQLGLKIEKQFDDIKTERANRANSTRTYRARPDLDKYVRHSRIKTKEHGEFVWSRQDLFGENMHDYGCWRGYTPKDQHHGAWKMHLFSVSEADWQTMCDVIIPYLKDHDIEWKTYNANYDAHYLNGSKQQGKAFTVYPKNNEDMAQIAKDLDYIIRKNKLETSNSHIIGDNQMGDTGRLFYRYEYNSGAYKDEILDLNNRADYDKYRSRYDANRGEGRYLADDMTIEDDIWRNFDPSDPDAQPTASTQDTYSAGRTTAKGCINSNEYSFYNFYDLRNAMADKFNLFSQDTQNKILQDLGRTGKCRLQKNGIEYQFTVNNGRVRLDEFDINVKYDIKHYQIDEYTTQKTCSIDDMDDLWWAIHDELNLFSIDSQNLIMQKLRNSETLVLRKYGIQYEFKMDRSGNVTVSEFAYEKFYNASTYQKANRNQSASSADNAQNYGRNMKPETRQAIEDLKGKIREKNTTIKALENQIENLKKKFMLPDYKVREYKTMLGIPENAQVTEISLKKAYNKKALETHPDKGGNAETFKKIQAANEALRKHFGFDDTRNKIQTETAELRQEIKNAKEEIEKYEAKINKLMNE